MEILELDIFNIKIIILCIVLLYCYNSSSDIKTNNFNIKISNIDTVTVNYSYYNPSFKQCDSTPLITADLSRIDINKLKSNKIRWCAVSRDLLVKNGGKFKYGDTILIISGNNLNGKKYVIHDCMNSKFKSKVDLLHYNRRYNLDKKIIKIVKQ